MRFHLASAIKLWNKVYDFCGQINTLTDTRKRRTYSKNMLVWMLILMFVLQFPSLNQFESLRPGQQLRLRHMIGMGSGKIPHRDALEDMAERLNVDELRALNWYIVRKQRKNKVFRQSAIDDLVAVAVDGIETYNSDKKQCEDCQTRRHNNGVVSFLHRFVVLVRIGGRSHTVIDVDMLVPRDGDNKQEGELTGGKRLIENNRAVLGHFADVVVGDALYFAAPFLNVVKACGMAAVIRLEDKTRKPFVIALKWIRSGHYHALTFKERDGRKHLISVTAADVRDVPMARYKGKTIRVIRFIEHDETNPNAKDKTLWAATTLPIEKTAHTVWKLVHARWDIENDVFNQIVVYYHAKHMYCHNAVEQFIWFIMIAFNLREAYLLRNRARDFFKSGYTRIDITEEFKDQLLQEPLKIPFQDEARGASS